MSYFFRFAHTKRTMEKHHDYKDTIREASGIDEKENAELERKKRTDAEIAYETLAVGAAMGYPGENAPQANIMQFAMLQEIVNKRNDQAFDSNPDSDKEDERLK